MEVHKYGWECNTQSDHRKQNFSIASTHQCLQMLHKAMGPYVLLFSDFQDLYKEWQLATWQLRRRLWCIYFTLFEGRKGFHAFGTIQACGIFHKVQISHHFAERGT